MTDRTSVAGWIERYQAAWRSRGVDSLQSVFTDNATYLPSPYAEPITGLECIGAMWEEERDGPDEVFSLHTEILAVDGDTAVIHALVRYGDPVVQEYRDLWIVRLHADGRCRWFEEWPFWPGKPRTARG